MSQEIAAELLVRCLEAEGVEYIFGLPGEENIHFINALHKSDKIRFILVRHEQGASFMADVYGRLTGKAGVCIATLGPGAINLMLGVTDANSDSAPVVAITAQVGLDRIYKETHQYVDLKSIFKNITKWSDTVYTTDSIPEMIRMAFDKAQCERPGAAYLGIPQDIEYAPVPQTLSPIRQHPRHTIFPDADYVNDAAKMLGKAKSPIILIGHGAVRSKAKEEIRALCDYMKIPVTTTFMAKGIVSDRKEYVLGCAGFMDHDYPDFSFDQADLILSIGYEFAEFSPALINPQKDKNIININTFCEDIDACFIPQINIIGDIKETTKLLLKTLKAEKTSFPKNNFAPKLLITEELSRNEFASCYPVKPQYLVNIIREVMADDEIVLADTGAVKMWMARLYPTYEPNTCLISNGLATMSFALPGAVGANFAVPDKKILAVMGDGSFMMNSQEIETAVRENIPLKILIWEDYCYGMIKWEMDRVMDTDNNIRFSNPDFVKYAESFGAHGYKVKSAESLKETLYQAINEEGVSIVICPVDYSENMKLTRQLSAISKSNLRI